MLQSPYSRGAVDGLKMGAYLTVMFFASILSQASALLSVLGLLMPPLVPLAVWLMMRRYGTLLGPLCSFAMLWMYGVVLFVCGLLISGSALEVYMTWIHPGYVAEQLEAVASMAGQMPGQAAVADVSDMARKMLDARFIPSPIQLVVQTVLLGTVTGSLLSMLLAALVNRRVHRSLRGTAR